MTMMTTFVHTNDGTTTTIVLLVEGTWRGAWAQARSRFSRMLRDAGFVTEHFQAWTRNVDGVPSLWQRGRHRSWIAGGYAFADKVRLLRAQHPGALIVAVCHSHGLQPILYGLARNEDVWLDRLISVCSPVRRDMQRQATGAVKRIGRWRHVFSSGWDFWQWAGELAIGHLQLWRERKWRQAHQNVPIDRIGHSKLLNNRRFLDLWKTDGMLDFLRGADVRQGVLTPPPPAPPQRGDPGAGLPW